MLLRVLMITVAFVVLLVALPLGFPHSMAGRVLFLMSVFCVGMGIGLYERT